MFWFSDFLNLFYPDVCAACGNGLFAGEQIICTHCLFHLPKTRFHELEGNPVEKQFWGKVAIHSATALYYFHKGERVQHLIHRLKYKGDTEVGTFTGNLLGYDLAAASRFRGITHVAPVPLHPAKKRLRGYNQSDFFAEGLAQVLKVPFLPDLLVRTTKTDSQTRKSRYSRYENMKSVFGVNPRFQLSDCHILLVDDVITTGSTLAECASELLTIPGASVSIATIAYARM